MNVAHMIEMHQDTRADITIAAYPMPVAQARRFGVMQVDERYRIIGFEEKPKEPKGLPDKPDTALTSMGNYIFSARALEELLHEAEREGGYDFGKDIIPKAIRDGYHVQAYDFARNPIPGQNGPNTYWRDVGTLDAYFEASMDLVSAKPEFDLYNPEFPLRTAMEFTPLPSSCTNLATAQAGPSTACWPEGSSFPEAPCAKAWFPAG